MPAVTTLNPERWRRDVVVIGASAGGIPALMTLFAALPGDFSGRLAVVLHRSAVYSGVLSQVLGRRSALPVVEPDDDDAFEPGRVYLAPRDRHLRIEGDSIRLSRGPREHHTRPAVDPLFVSAAQSFGPRVVGVVLSGMGNDGVAGLIAIERAGGMSLVQDPEEAMCDGMPRNALLHDDVHAALSVEAIAGTLGPLTEGASITPRALRRARGVSGEVRR